MAEAEKRRRSRAGARALCVLGGLFAGLVLAELMVRLLGVGPEMFAVHFETFRISDDPVLEYELVPGAVFSSVPFSSAGLRDREFSEEKPEGVYRIAVIGDSVTFGLGVDGAQSYPKELETLLNRYREPGAPTFEVMNFGVIGYNAAQLSAMPDARVARFDPDCIIYGYVLNDPQAWSLEVEALEILKEGWRGDHLAGIGRQLRHSRLYLLLRASLADEPEQPDLYDQEPGGVAFREERHVSYLRSLHERVETWRSVTACLHRLSRPAGKPGAPPVIVTTFPIEWDYGSDAYALTDIHERVIAEARGNGLLAIDLAPAFERVAGVTGDKLFVDFLHPSPLGHKVAALALLKELCVSEVLPPDCLRLERVQSAASPDHLLAWVVFNLR